MSSAKRGSAGPGDFVSPIRLRWTVLTLGFVIVAASASLAIWILAFVGAVSVGPSKPPFWEATPFAAVLVIIGAGAFLVVNIRAHSHGQTREDTTILAKVR